MTPQIEVYTTKEEFFQLLNAEECQTSIYRIKNQQEDDWDIKLEYLSSMLKNIVVNLA